MQISCHCFQKACNGKCIGISFELDWPLRDVRSEFPVPFPFEFQFQFPFLMLSVVAHGLRAGMCQEDKSD